MSREAQRTGENPCENGNKIRTDKEQGVKDEIKIHCWRGMSLLNLDSSGKRSEGLCLVVDNNN